MCVGGSGDEFDVCAVDDEAGRPVAEPFAGSGVGSCLTIGVKIKVCKFFLMCV